MLLSVMRWISWGQGVLTARHSSGGAFAHFPTAIPDERTSKNVCVWVDGCTAAPLPGMSASQQMLLHVSVCVCVCACLEGDGGILAKWALQMPLIARWIREDIPLGRGQRINSYSLLGQFGNGLRSEQRQTVSTWATSAQRRTLTGGGKRGGWEVVSDLDPVQTCADDCTR